MWKQGSGRTLADAGMQEGRLKFHPTPPRYVCATTSHPPPAYTSTGTNSERAAWPSCTRSWPGARRCWPSSRYVAQSNPFTHPPHAHHIHPPHPTYPHPSYTQSTSGNFPTVTRFLLAKIGDKGASGGGGGGGGGAAFGGSSGAAGGEGQKKSIVYDQHVFHYVVEGSGLVYLCMVDDTENKRRLAFLFLEEIQRRFKAAYGDAALTVRLGESRWVGGWLVDWLACLGSSSFVSLTHLSTPYPLQAIAFAMNESFSPTLKSMMDFYNADPSADNLHSLRTKIDDTKSVMVENIDQVGRWVGRWVGGRKGREGRA